MKKVSVEKICIAYDIPQSFVDSLFSFNLIELVEVDDERFIQVDDIERLNKLMRLYYELNVNYEGLDVVNNLLNQISVLKERIRILENRIDFYEP